MEAQVNLLLEEAVCWTMRAIVQLYAGWSAKNDRSNSRLSQRVRSMEDNSGNHEAKFLSHLHHVPNLPSISWPLIFKLRKFSCHRWIATRQLFNRYVLSLGIGET